MLYLYCRFDLIALLRTFTLNSNKFRMVHKVDGNPQLDPRDWSMYKHILKYTMK